MDAMDLLEQHLAGGERKLAGQRTIGRRHFGGNGQCRQGKLGDGCDLGVDGKKIEGL